MSQVQRENGQAAPLRVAQLSDAEFKRLVDEDTRGKAPASLSKQLRSTECAGRWYETLMAMQKSVEGQLAAKNTESKAAQARLKAQLADPKRRNLVWSQVNNRAADDFQWRSGALRFKSGLEERLIEAKGVIRDLDMPLIYERLADERNRALARVSLLEDAIREHRQNFPLEEDVPSDADLRLWQLI